MLWIHCLLTHVNVRQVLDQFPQTWSYCWMVQKSCTSWGWQFLPVFTGFYTSQVVWKNQLMILVFVRHLSCQQKRYLADFFFWIVPIQDFHGCWGRFQSFPSWVQISTLNWWEGDLYGPWKVTWLAGKSLFSVGNTSSFMVDFPLSCLFSGGLTVFSVRWKWWVFPSRWHYGWSKSPLNANLLNANFVAKGEPSGSSHTTCDRNSHHGCIDLLNCYCGILWMHFDGFPINMTSFRGGLL